EENEKKTDSIVESSVDQLETTHKHLVKTSLKLRKTKKGKRALESEPTLEKSIDTLPTTYPTVDIDELRNQFINEFEPMPEVRNTRPHRRPRLRTTTTLYTTTSAPSTTTIRVIQAKPIRKKILRGTKRFTRRPSLRTTTHTPLRSLDLTTTADVDDLITALQREADAAARQAAQLAAIRASLSEDLSDVDLVSDARGERSPTANNGRYKEVVSQDKVIRRPGSSFVSSFSTKRRRRVVDSAVELTEYAVDLSQSNEPVSYRKIVHRAYGSSYRQ
ncbi:hypothetical protein PMAYCL1PPCAC_06334, partial [Pristionchus mayeri]